MENNIERFNLSKDLRQIFGVVFELSRQKDQYEVSIDAVISAILCRYVRVEDDEDFKKMQSTIIEPDTLLEGYFETLQEDTKKGIIDIVNEVMEQDIKSHKNKWGSIFKSPHHDNSIVLSEGLDFLLKRLEARYEHEEITAFDFFLSAGIDPIESEVMKRLKDDLGITYDVLSAYKMANKLAESIMGKSMGELKEKTVNYSDEDEESRDEGNDKREEARKRFETDDREFETAGSDVRMDSPDLDPNSTTPFLDKYGVNMTQEAKEGKYDPVIGRDLEISQVIEILSCRKKKNVILVGVQGTGKSSIVEELARRIVEGNVPRELLGKQIRSVDLTSIVSGAVYRGMAEERAENCFREALRDKNIILYIDEIHNIIGNGSSSGTGGTDEIIKPYLSRVDGISVIGSTTESEYHKFIEKNGALKRRFQEVSISEPTMEQTINILSGIAYKYEEFHKVKYTPEVIRACTEWSARYVMDQFFPDKALTVLDISGSLTKLERIVDMSAVENLEKSIDTLIQEKISLVESCDFEEAQKRRDLENTLTQELGKEKEKIDQELNNPNNWPEVTLDKVASVISKMSRVPVDKIRETDFDRLKSMKKAMESRIIGQPQAIRKVFMSLSRQFMGIKDPNKPISMIFLGRTATGKSELSKVIADEVFAGEKNLIQINGGDYIEKGSVSKLIGASASYVGYDDEPLLLQVKRRPFSVLLIDEIEKMSDEIINTVFLPILDEGKITLANNEEVSFRNQIIIATSNLGCKEIDSKTSLGFGKKTKEIDEKENEEIILKAVKKKFRPEMLNRFTGGIIYFNSLGIPELLQIFDLELKKLQGRLKDKGFEISVTQEMKEFIVGKCDLQYGARDLQREMSKYIEEAVIDAMMEQQGEYGKSIVVSLDGDKPKVTFNTTLIMNVEKKEQEKA